MGSIERETWTQLVSAVFPKVTAEETEFYFDVLDRDRQGRLDCIDFLDLREVTQLRLYPCTPGTQPIRGWAHSWLRRRAVRLDSVRLLHRFPLLFVLLTGVILSCYWRGISTATQRALAAVTLAIAALWTAEVAVKIMARQGSWKRPAVILDASGAVISLALLAAATNGGVTEIAALIGNTLILLRSMWRVDRIRVGWQVVVRVAPILFSVSLLILITIYVYAIIGMDVFANTTPSVTASTKALHYNDFNCGNGFPNLACALFTLFQQLVGNNWHEPMNAIIEVRRCERGPVGVAVRMSSFSVCLSLSPMCGSWR